MLARIACDRLDRVDDLYTAWPVDAGAGEFTLEDEMSSITEPSAAIVHWVQQISGSIDIVKKGYLLSRPPLEPISIDYPGMGKGTAYTVGHPEPITLHTNMNVQGDSANLMVLKRSTAAILIWFERNLIAADSVLLMRRTI